MVKDLCIEPRRLKDKKLKDQEEKYTGLFEDCRCDSSCTDKTRNENDLLFNPKPRITKSEALNFRTDRRELDLKNG